MLSLTANVIETVTHNLGTNNVIIDFIDTLSNERVEGHADNYTMNSVDITVTNTNPNIKVVILAAGGSGIPSPLPAYKDDSDAGSNGLSTGEYYQTDGTSLAVPLNQAGIVMVKQ